MSVDNSHNNETFDFDQIIIGSGFGGSKFYVNAHLIPDNKVFQSPVWGVNL
jgi:hypothetical protein